MTEDSLFRIRHSLAHILAMALRKRDPGLTLATGPVTNDGFFYDVKFSDDISISPEDFKKIESDMRGIIARKLPFVRRIVTAKEAQALFKDNRFKLEIIAGLEKEDVPITIYETGNPESQSGTSFIDLCEGPHVENTSEIDPKSFALKSTAGAYWHGDEHGEMLTRISGFAFETETDLTDHLSMLEESKKRDHRKLGELLSLFTFDDQVGAGLPLWLPNGTIIIEELETLAKNTERVAGYRQVRTPHIAKESLYLTSGHLPYYEDSMYPPMEYEGAKYYLKAMNCPHHHKIFAASPKSYRDLPLRLAEYGTVYRHEKSGELFGLMRVRMMQMNDAHIYCTKEQFADEFRRVNDLYLKYFKIFGIEKYIMRLSLHDPAQLGKKYVNEPELWLETEKMVRDVLIESRIPFVEVPNEAAFYGPKIDVQVWSAIGREFTLATNQVDFAVPKRFGLSFTNRNGKEETPLCIHRAPLGTHERFIGFLIEHYAGAFPLWLAPIQVALLPISEKHREYANEIRQLLEASSIRTEQADENESLGKRIRAAKLQKIPYLVVVGDKEAETDTVSVDNRERGQLGQLRFEEFLESLRSEISMKK